METEFKNVSLVFVFLKYILSQINNKLYLYIIYLLHNQLNYTRYFFCS